MATRIDFPIIDAHVHLYAASHLDDLAWAPSLADDHILKQQSSITEYREAVKSQPNLLGLVFVEVDRKSALTSDNWQAPIREVEFLRRIKADQPQPGEGHYSGDSKLLLGAVAWAPVAAQEAALTKYLAQSGAEQDFKSPSGLIRGARYLLQDKPEDHAVWTTLPEGLLVLEKAGCKVFDLGVDMRQQGVWQLVRAVKLLQKFSEKSSGQMKIVINHFCKPNLQDSGTDIAKENRKSWAQAVRALADLPMTVMKLSGLFSELPQQNADEPMPVQELLERTRFEMEIVFDNFGAENIMFGSDWPVCNVGGPGAEKSWAHWVQFVAAVLDDRNLDDVDKARVWAGTAIATYQLDVNLGN